MKPYRTQSGLGDKGRDAGRNAAAAAAAGTANEVRARALSIIEAATVKGDGKTADEVAEMMGLSVLSVRPRISELANQGLIYEADLPKRLSANGRPMTVWAASSKEKNDG